MYDRCRLEECFIEAYCVERFYLEIMYSFATCSFCIYCNAHIVFIFCFVSVDITLIDWWIMKCSYIPGIKLLAVYSCIVEYVLLIFTFGICIYILDRNMPVVFFFGRVCICFGIMVFLPCWNECSSIIFLPLLWNSFREGKTWPHVHQISAKSIGFFLKKINVYFIFKREREGESMNGGGEDRETHTQN